MCSFDVKSLFTNVPILETINICLDTLYRCNEVTRPATDEPIIKKLLLKCTQDVQFSFNNRMYRQIDGVTMGSPLGPIVASIFLGYCESRIPEDQWPDFYKRYVDDTFSLFLGGKRPAMEFLDLLNHLHPSLQFTMESETDGKLPFLDALVIRDGRSFSTTVYRKPTATGVYVRWDSFCPTGQKFALIKSLVNRAKRICSSQHLEKEIAGIKNILKENGYPVPIIERVLAQTLHPEPPVFGPKLKPIYIRLPWLGAPSSALSNKLQQATAKAIHWCRSVCSFNYRRGVSTCRKDVLPAESISNIVYLFKCECHHTYVGRTIQRLEERISQHVPKPLIETVAQNSGDTVSGKRGRGRPRKTCNPLEINKADTAITRHLKEASSCLRAVAQNVTEHFHVLGKGRSLLHIQFLEALFISSHHPPLCTQKEHVMSLALF